MYRIEIKKSWKKVVGICFEADIFSALGQADEMGTVLSVSEIKTTVTRENILRFQYLPLGKGMERLCNIFGLELDEDELEVKEEC